MYLKSIEVQGFKSFANKILFEFHNGITAIVGPNGSGKSNVADAVRWVLGEQSAKQLRGSNMQDIIFSGTENRKPLGFAYVAITLDNSDHKLAIEYEEITVARKVYRSGESEYLINGSVCRLKDVQELFYDTGVGKEGYSLIGQGQIDKILSGKPEERRELFDEAAGIVKFKRRKKAANKNLEDERQNLVRINDILSELEKQVGPLLKQSEKARIYLKKKEELKEYDVNLFLLEIQRIKEQLSETEKKYSIVSADLEETKLRYESTKAEFEQLEQEIEAVESKIEEYRGLLNEASILGQKKEGEINLLKEQIAGIEERKNRLLEQKQKSEQELSERLTQKEQLQSQKADMDLQLNQIITQQSEAQMDLEDVQKNIQNIQNQIERAKSGILDLLNEKASIQSRQQRYDTMLEQVQIRKAELNQRILKIKSSENEQDEFIKKYEAELEEVCERIAKLSDMEKECKKHLAALKEENAQSTKQLSEYQTDYHRKHSKLDSLISITERYDGYGNAIRKVMEQKEHNTGIVGVVADIIKTDKKYETAIETALGGNIQNIVTDTEETAKKMIEFLKKNHYGRATFLPLTSMNGRDSFSKEAALKEACVLGVASRLVQTDSAYNGLVNYLLGKTMVVDTMEHAIQIARKYQYSIRMVTLDGELLNPGGSMTGGAFKNSNNLLGRRREIEELQEQTKQAKVAVENLNMKIEQVREEITVKTKEAQELSEQLQGEFLLQNTVKLNLNQAMERKAELSKSYDSLKTESSEIEIQIQEIRFQKNHIQEEVLLTQNKAEELDKLVDELQLKLQNEQQTESGRKQEFSRQQIAHAGLFQKHDNVMENIRRLEQEISKYEQEIAEIDGQISKADLEGQEKNHLIEGIKAEYTKLVENNMRYEETLQEFSRKKEQLTENNKSFLTRREELMERISALDKESYRLNSQKEKLEEQNEESMNYMWEEYELTYNAALPLKKEDIGTAAEVKRKIQSLRTDIRNLGDVNVNAIEEYKTVSERYEFLNKQRNDLLEAEKTLMQIVQELDEGMRKQFKEKFAQIQVEFDKAFKELFGGGKGTLELENEEDILEAGIRIVSQPPGKKLGNMMQLSGGEKALTAIALLFAIQNLKPSPFCLLDEIEAALDDSNVSRYAKYLHKLTKNTQFIIITHRRGSMAAADRLYGITMQEKGVSTLVSVDLIESELDK